MNASTVTISGPLLIFTLRANVEPSPLGKPATASHLTGPHMRLHRVTKTASYFEKNNKRLAGTNTGTRSADAK